MFGSIGGWEVGLVALCVPTLIILIGCVSIVIARLIWDWAGGLSQAAKEGD